MSFAHHTGHTLAALCLLCTAVMADADQLRGSGDLALVVERASGSVQIVETSGDTSLCRVEGLGDLSHASAVFSRDQRYAFVFGRDGGLSKVDMLTCRLVARTVQAGNSIGGAISQDGRLVAVSNYEPGGVRVFAADTLKPVADIPATYGDGQTSKVIGLVDAPGQRFVFSLWDAGETWVADMRDPAHPVVTRFTGIGRNPYDALGVTTSPGCSAKTAWRFWTCGTWMPASSASCPTMARASRNCRCTKCRTSKAGRSPADAPSYRQSGATKCW